MLWNPKLGDATQCPRLLKVGASAPLAPELAKAGHDCPSGQEANVTIVMSTCQVEFSQVHF